MKNKHYASVKAMDDQKIFGQFISIVSVTEPSKYDLVEEYRDLGIRKVSSFQTHLFKKNYMTIINTSTGAINAGVEFKQVKESPYQNEALEGLCSCLKSDNNKKYIVVKFKGENSANVVYVDHAGKVYDGQVILKPKKESAREKAIVAIVGEEEKPSFRAFKIESIYSISIAGQIFVDEELEDIVKKAGMV